MRFKKFPLLLVVMSLFKLVNFLHRSLKPSSKELGHLLRKSVRRQCIAIRMESNSSRKNLGSTLLVSLARHNAVFQCLSETE